MLTSAAEGNTGTLAQRRLWTVRFKMHYLDMELTSLLLSFTCESGFPIARERRLRRIRSNSMNGTSRTVSTERLTHNDSLVVSPAEPAFMGRAHPTFCGRTNE